MADPHPSLDLFRLVGIIPPAASPGLVELYRRAAERLELLLLDYQSIRDLLTLAGVDSFAAHALLLCHFDMLAQGSLCLPLAKHPLAERLAPLVDDPAGVAVDIHRLVHSNAVDDLIGQSPDSATPLILVHTHHGPCLYSQKTLIDERGLSAQLQRLLDTPHPSDLPADPLLQEIVAEVTVHRPSCGGDGRPLTLAPGQRLALWTALLQPFTIISGGPGTGKTSTVLSILRCLARCGVAPADMALTAPTGRAAQRLTEAIAGGLRAIPATLPPADQPLIELTGATIHSLLRYNPRRHEFQHGLRRPLPIRLLVVDEVSMVDVATMGALLQAVPPGARVIFLGDKDQLPSVDAGAVLADLIPRRARQRFSTAFARRLRHLDPALPAVHETTASSPLADRVVLLNESHRSEQSIKQVAAAVNAQQIHLLGHLERLDSPARLLDWSATGGCRFLDLPITDRDAWQQLLDAWIDLHYRRLADSGATVPYPLLVRQIAEIELTVPTIAAESPHFPLFEALFRAVEQARILTFIREGRFGCQGINAYVCARLRPLLDPGGRVELFAGCPILITRNDYQRQVYNGDVGVVLRDRQGNWRAAFRRLGAYLLFPLELLPVREPAFAMTIHKSQGSEYRHVLITLPANRQHRLLSKEILYTGLTRARSLALIAGTLPVLEQAIRHHISRVTGLDLWPPDPDDPADSTWGTLQLFER